MGCNGQQLPRRTLFYLIITRSRGRFEVLRPAGATRCTDGGEIWHGGGDLEEGTFNPLLRVKFHLHRCNVSPLRGEKPQNRPLSKLNTGRFALRAMLPVKIGS